MSKIYLSPPDVGNIEREMLIDAIDSGWVAPLGPHVDGFERELSYYVNAQNAVALSSGTAGLHLALVSLGVGPHDEVFVSNKTFVASANAVAYVGATPVFIDSEKSSWNMCPQALEEAFIAKKRAGKLPKAVVCVDLYGFLADYENIQRVCRNYDVPLIEDSAEALGSHYQSKHAGTFGDMGVFSFNGNKIITTSGGGMLVTANDDRAQHIRHLATQARQPRLEYHHLEVGYNYRLSNLLAAVGRAQLSRLEDILDRTTAHHKGYCKRLDSLPGVEVHKGDHTTRPNYWLTCVSLNKSCPASRDDVIEKLAAEDIESRPTWKPMHMQPVYKDCELFGKPLSKEIFETSFCLPSGSTLTSSERERICDIIESLF